MAYILQERNQPPTLAILTVKDNKRRIFRGNLDNFIDLIRTGNEMGVDAYVVTTSDFSLSSSRMMGYRYDFEKKKWSRELVPAPHVVYNRIPYRKMELKPDVQQVLQTCMRSGQVEIFNPSFFNKLTLFEWLNKSKEGKPFIPETLQLNAVGDLNQLLRRHTVLYLKPAKGKAGKGIMRLERISAKNKQAEYRLSRQENKNMEISTHQSIESLWQAFNKYRGYKEYIAQQGITLTRFKQRAYDLRALIQKSSKGTWLVSGIGARVAGKASITTHVPRGGSIDNPLKLLTQAFGAKEAGRILKRAKSAAVTLAKAIEKSSGSHLGEMSMDLGVDTSGRIWFFEANSKPMKFDEPEIRRKSLERIIGYSLYLTNSGKRR
ncbi:YheC/YheD family endospore coat-associated protein [Paenibacillus hexagrammi]|uniref:YheC/YheD family protein n=1 Tax=Paenibacillus hexagrammi TaxID=2908839 RepID=A0ABY3SMF2_9BACL|nr:YheC/YheD family protein [Paenibacillus sp. YPD9-1]UJF34715.1 YheC/YheD family protein [Paenibacillus sp. YPD9-1]